MVLGGEDGLSTESQEYNPTPIINEVRSYVEAWRQLPNPDQWKVTPATAQLLRHWRHHQFQGIKPFFCQVEAVETAIWLAEVAPKFSTATAKFGAHLKGANAQANPELMRVALKLATGAGKTTVMAMLIAWQTVNAVRHHSSKQFSRGFLVVAPGITIKDRLRVLQPNDPESYYRHRELVPPEMLADIDKAKIVITNYHAFKLRERIDIAKGTRSALEGWREEKLETLETEGQMLQRVMPELMGLKNLVVLNDEAHHCYRERVADDSVEDLKGEEKDEAKENNEAARMWISGLETVKRKLGLAHLYDLSATPFFLRGSGYAEGTLFPWTMSDFSLMDAIECGSAQLESGDALDKNFREMAADEIEQFRKEMVERTGDARAGETIDDATLLREVMNTIGKKGRLGEQVRCVVSVSMLTEGWDANTVTHVLGVRAFGTQLLCEQVVGRGLRRQSYELNDQGLFNVEYADVLGIPFDFAAKPVIAPPAKPRETVRVHAVRPDRDALSQSSPSPALPISRIRTAKLSDGWTRSLQT